MQKYNALKNIFFVRGKKEWAKCYERTDFWVTIMAGVCLLLSYVLARYVDGRGIGTTYAQAWRLTAGNWALVTCGILSGLCGLYIMIINLFFRNSAVLSGINIALGIFIAILFVMEYMILKKVGFDSSGTKVILSNNAGIGFFLGIVGAFLFTGLEFYKLGAQGYYTTEEIEKEKENAGVKIVDGIVLIDGEAIDTKIENGNEIIVEEIPENAEIESAQAEEKSEMPENEQE